jgi:RNA polymerase sigma-70 factor (ECF subfamily)
VPSARQPSPGTTAIPTDGSALAAEAQAFTDNFDYLVRTMRRLGVVEIDVEDLAQDVFLVMCRRWSEYRPQVPIRSWLAGIAFNVARKHLARIWREIPDAELDTEDQRLNPDESLQAQRARQLVLGALESMRPRDRAILSLCEIDEVPVQEAAALLAIPLFTAYTRLRRARERFAQVVTELQSRTSAGRSLSAAALLAIERQPTPPTVDSRQRASRVMRAALSRVAPQSGRWSPGGPTIAVAGAVALLALGTAYAVMPHGRAFKTASSAVQASGLDRNLVGVWGFDDSPGSTVARDRSAARRDCRLHAIDGRTAWVGGVHAGAIDLGHGWIECPQPTVAATARTPMSVALWVNAAAISSGHAALVTRQLGDGPTDYFFLGMLGPRLKVRSSLWSKDLAAPRPLPLHRWVHVAFTHDGDGMTRLYQDGVEVMRGPTSSKHRATITTPVSVGAGIDGPDQGDRGEQFTGLVDELSLWDRALAPEEIAALARGARPRAAD